MAAISSGRGPIWRRTNVSVKARVSADLFRSGRVMLSSFSETRGWGWVSPSPTLKSLGWRARGFLQPGLPRNRSSPNWGRALWSAFPYAAGANRTAPRCRVRGLQLRRGRNEDARALGPCRGVARPGSSSLLSSQRTTGEDVVEIPPSTADRLLTLPSAIGTPLPPDTTAMWTVPRRDKAAGLSASRHQ